MNGDCITYHECLRRDLCVHLVFLVTLSACHNESFWSQRGQRIHKDHYGLLSKRTLAK